MNVWMLIAPCSTCVFASNEEWQQALVENQLKKGQKPTVELESEVWTAMSSALMGQLNDINMDGVS